MRSILARLTLASHKPHRTVDQDWLTRPGDSATRVGARRVMRRRPWSTRVTNFNVAERTRAVAGRACTQARPVLEGPLGTTTLPPGDSFLNVGPSSNP